MTNGKSTLESYLLPLHLPARVTGESWGDGIFIEFHGYANGYFFGFDQNGSPSMMRGDQLNFWSRHEKPVIKRMKYAWLTKFSSHDSLSIVFNDNPHVFKDYASPDFKSAHRAPALDCEI